MNASGGFYPSLGRYFKSLKELARAGCMSERRCRDCLDGIKDFSRAEQKAIAANIVVRVMEQPVIDYGEMERAVLAWKGQFDEIYRRKEVNHEG